MCSEAYRTEQIKNLMVRIDMVTSVVSTVTMLIWSVSVVHTGGASTPEPEGIPDGPTQKWTVHQVNGISRISCNYAHRSG